MSESGFQQAATKLSRNPLGIIALFIVLIYGFACLVLGLTSSLNETDRALLVKFIVFFPVVVFAGFIFLVVFHNGKLYAPGDYKNDEAYLSATGHVDVRATITAIEEKTNTLSAQIQVSEAALEVTGARPPHTDTKEIDALIRAVIDETEKSPRSALVMLSAKLEHEMRRLLLLSGHAGEIKNTGSLLHLARLLERAVNLPDGTFNVVADFSKLRNEIVHGAREVDDSEMLRMIDSGLSILRTIGAVPLERNVVKDGNVQLFCDKEAQQPAEGVHGVLLETHSPGGISVSERIFPSTRTHFKEGHEVTWEWNDSMRWGRLFYKDATTGLVKSGWDASLEFIGRPLEQA